MQYIGEHLLPGKIGQLCLTISLIMSLLAAIAYYKSFKAKTSTGAQSWRNLGRLAFIIDTAAFLAVFIVLYLLIRSHYFEYFYVYKNSGKDLEPKYILSALWSASEGSFLLWAVWHGLLGLFLIVFTKKWEGPVMAVFSAIHFLLATMLAGIYFLGWRMGVSPFVLFRNEKSDLPLFNFPDYLSKITDGNGLNQLLQNYWMVIHPPVLFLGFAFAAVPFSFAMGGLLTNNHRDWAAKAQPWLLAGAAILGIGIMMGGAWAYESLSFGGYWAWDPVENASLVPWMVMVSGLHTLLIYKHTARSLRATYLFLLLGFILVVYSTFLTRSGILGDTSVHSFADLGMNFQLLLFLLLILVPSLALFLIRYKSIPHLKKEEESSSREFWMFIGSLVFFFSALVIIAKTSVPVYNKVFKTNFASPKEVEYSYNSIMVWVAIIIGLLTAITHYLKYKSTAKDYFFKKILVPTLVSSGIAALVLIFGKIDYSKFGLGYLAAIWVALVAGIYAVIANASYIWIGLRGKLKYAGGPVAHVGFGMMLCGILISASKKETLSHNIGGLPVPLAETENPNENLTLIKGMPVNMGKYRVTYESDSVHPKKPLWYYRLKFESQDEKEKFYITPNAFVNYQNNEGLMANPDAKHFWDHDVFTYITSLPNPEAQNDTSQFKEQNISLGDTLIYSNGFLVLNSISKKTDNLPVELFGNEGAVFKANITVVSKDSVSYQSAPTLIYAQHNKLSMPDTVVAQGITLKFSEINGNKYRIGIKESEALIPFITIKTYKFPFINLLWLGTFIMAIGMVISMARRWQEVKTARGLA